jgi:hypothetical protein
MATSTGGSWPHRAARPTFASRLFRSGNRFFGHWGKLMIFRPEESMPAQFRPTPEQQAIVDAAGSGDNLKIKAYAGAGKTSTLRLVATASLHSAVPTSRSTGKSLSMRAGAFRITSSRGLSTRSRMPLHRPP